VKKLVVLVVVLGLLVGAAVIADRVALGIAEDTVASRLEESRFGGAEVDIPGFPFLTQVARNRYGTIGITAAEYVTAEGDRLTDVHGELGDASVEGGSSVLARSARLNAVVPFESVQRRLPAGRLQLSLAGDLVRVSRTIEVLGRSYTPSATATVEVRGDQLVVEPVDVDLPGAGPVDDLVLDAAREQLTLSYPVVGLPAGVRLERVDVVGDGFRVHLTGSDVRLP
jgi:hypothetical protein